MLNGEPTGTAPYADTAPERCVSPESQRTMNGAADEKGEIDLKTLQKIIKISIKKRGEASP